MRITQVLVSDSLIFFKKNFIDRWGFVEYTDHNKPCVFFGGKELSSIIQNHNSIKIVLPGFPNDIPNFTIVTNRKNLYLISPPHNLIPNDVISKNFSVEIKDYSIFKPTILGDKIYAYSGFKNGWQPNDLSKLNEIQKRIDYEIITTNHINKTDMYDINYLKSNYYDKCFLNLNFTNGHGMTTVRELGLMGRMTIMNESHYKYPCIIGYDSNDDLIEKINKESKKIGTIQNSINSHTINDEWVYTEFWGKK
jgi:hypothetical protein